jgi:hypothetical protein
VKAVIENTSDVAPRPEPSSSAMGSKKAPKLYATPNTANIDVNAATTARHARRESTPGWPVAVVGRRGHVSR